MFPDTLGKGFRRTAFAAALLAAAAPGVALAPSPAAAQAVSVSVGWGSPGWGWGWGGPGWGWGRLVGSSVGLVGRRLGLELALVGLGRLVGRGGWWGRPWGCGAAGAPGGPSFWFWLCLRGLRFPRLRLPQRLRQRLPCR